MHEIGGYKCSTRSFSNWYKGKYTPDLQAIVAIEQVLFGDDHAPANNRDDFHAAWERAHRFQRAKDAPPSAAAVPEAQTVPLEPRPSRLPPHSVLVDMTVSDTQGSTADDAGPLVELRHGLDQVEGVAVNVAIGVKRLTVRYEGTNCEPKGPRHGEGSNVDGVKTAAWGWEFTAAQGGVLNQPTIEVLARFHRIDRTQPCGVTFVASVEHSDDLEPVFRNPDDNLPAKAKGVIGRYLANKKYERRSRIVLARAKLDWEPPR